MLNVVRLPAQLYVRNNFRFGGVVGDRRAFFDLLAQRLMEEPHAHHQGQAQAQARESRQRGIRLLYEFGLLEQPSFGDSVLVWRFSIHGFQIRVSG